MAVAVAVIMVCMAMSWCNRLRAVKGRAATWTVLGIEGRGFGTERVVFKAR